MKVKLFGMSLAAVLLTGALWTLRPVVSRAAAAEPADGSAPLVVVELFTSQGCSSCPPADRLLSRLADDPQQRVVALAFHVDYWNYLGWRDPFSAAEWSQRQGRYAGALAAGRRYTPQLVVDGRDHCVGSVREDVDRLVATARRRAETARVELAVAPAAAGRLVVEASADLVGDAEARSLDLLLAIVENDIVTPVRRGENARKTLHNDFVVRRLIKMASIDAGEASSTAHRLVVEIADGWQARNVGVVAFLQDPRSLAIHGAAAWSPTESRS